jgi:clan AA aspartic protease
MASGKIARISTVVDTGFNDSLTLPAALIQALGLPMHTFAHYVQADGQRQQCTVYEAEVEWLGEWRSVHVIEVEGSPLLGMKLLAGTRLTIDIAQGGSVDIQALSLD